MTRVSFLVTIFILLASDLWGAKLHGNRADYAEYGPNGKYLAIAGDDLLLLDRRGREIRLVNESAPEARVVSFSQDGQWLAAESDDYQIHIYRVEKARRFPVFFQGIKKRAGVQSRLVFSPDGDMLATSNNDKIVIYSLLDGQEGEVLLTIPRASSNVHRSTASFVATPDWKYFFHNMQLIKLTKDAKGKLSFERERTISWEGIGTSLYTIAPDASKVVVAGRGGLDQAVFDLKTGNQIMGNTNLKTYALAANKDFSKIYMNQAVWDIKNKKMQTLYQTGTKNKNTRTQISVASDGEFMIGLYQYSNKGRLLKDLQKKVTSFNRVKFEGEEVHFMRDYRNGRRFDLFSVNYVDGVRGRSSRNVPNKNTINVALASSSDGSFGISHLSQMIRRSSMTVSAPVFTLGASKGLAAAISANDLVALVNRHSIYVYDFRGAINDPSKGKVLKTIKLDEFIPARANVKLCVSPDNRYIALSYTDGGVDREFSQHNSKLMIYAVGGKKLFAVKTRSVSDIKFSPISHNLYLSSGRRLTCYSLAGQKWQENAQRSWYSKSGRITAFAINSDDTKIAYGASDGHNKVVSAKLGIVELSCVMQENDVLKVTK